MAVLDELTALRAQTLNDIANAATTAELESVRAVLPKKSAPRSARL